MNLKSILIHTNFCNDSNGEPAISPVVVEIFDLKVGENVIVYQDEDEWRRLIDLTLYRG